MKNYNEIANRVLERRNEYETAQRQKRKKIVYVSSAVSCFAVVAVLGVGIWQGDWLHSGDILAVDPLLQDGVGSDTLGTVGDTVADPITDPITQTNTPNQNIGDAPDEGIYSSGGDIGNWWCIPALPADREIALTGEAITDEEAQAYFEENRSSMISALASSGVSTEAVRISDKGYSHISYEGIVGKSFELKQNYRDYLVYSGDELIAIITLYKENGEIFNTPSFGAKWFEDYNAYLKAHKGEELVYAYAGWFEIIIAPDNTYHNPMGLDVSPYLGGIDEPYELFYHEGAVYVP